MCKSTLRCILVLENSMEAIRAVQRDKREFGISAAYHGTIEINRDSTDSDVKNAVNYGRLKNRITNSGVIREKVKNDDVLCPKNEQLTLRTDVADW
jgi:hypothetical protein